MKKNKRQFSSIYIKPKDQKVWEKFKKYAKNNRYSYSELLLKLVDQFMGVVEDEKINNPYAKKYQLNYQQIDNIKKEAVHQTMNIIAFALNNEFNFGKKRINKLMDRVKFDMEAIDSGHLDMQDILDTVKNEILKE
jgi:hypothetical protein